MDKDFFQIVELFEEDRESKALKEKLGPLYSTYKDLEDLANMKGIQARMPFNIEIN